MTVQAVDGSAPAITVGRRLRLIESIKMEAGTPLSDPDGRCHGTVRKGGVKWWFTCHCGTRLACSTWDEAYRRAHRHVRVARLVSYAITLGREAAW